MTQSPEAVDPLATIATKLQRLRSSIRRAGMAMSEGSQKYVSSRSGAYLAQQVEELREQVEALNAEVQHLRDSR